MNWDWDKLQEKRQNQQQNGWPAPDKDQRDRDQDDDRDMADRNERPQPMRDTRHDQRPPSGGGNGGNSGGPGGFDPMRAIRGANIPGGKWWIVALVGLWLASGIYIVQPDEAGVVLRFGKYNRTETAGPHYHFPYPFEEVYRPKVSQVRQAEVGFRSQTSGGTFQQGRVQAVDEEASMLTGDENIVSIQFNIQYHIKPDGAVDYLFNVAQPDAVVKKAAEAAMREVIGKTTLDAALTGGRAQIQDDVTQLLQNILDRYQVGVQVVAVQMQDVQPPREVGDAFKDVASAREDKQRLTNQAEAYRRDILPKAQGDAAEIVFQAEAYRQTRVRAAEGDADRFLSVLTEYEKAPDITKKRLLLEALEDIMSQPGMEKTILPEGMSQNVLPFLPLDSGMRAAPAAKPATQSTSGAVGASGGATGANGPAASTSNTSSSTSMAPTTTGNAGIATAQTASANRSTRTTRGAF